MIFVLAMCLFALTSADWAQYGGSDGSQRGQDSAVALSNDPLVDSASVSLGSSSTQPMTYDKMVFSTSVHNNSFVLNRLSVDGGAQTVNLVTQHPLTVAPLANVSLGTASICTFTNEHKWHVVAAVGTELYSVDNNGTSILTALCNIEHTRCAPLTDASPTHVVCRPPSAPQVANIPAMFVQSRRWLYARNVDGMPMWMTFLGTYNASIQPLPSVQTDVAPAICGDTVFAAASRSAAQENGVFALNIVNGTRRALDVDRDINDTSSTPLLHAMTDAS